ncbi:hypothetical protein QNI16_19545 [Cytophagaceae bacterium YF14B1]|uniref:Uncharacterized protein n=1 Tax=Xanthocytophaga flava TaxID=3048013 RepID=A0AAE3UAE1_9BACT|nr:hypothetical protein [Xanthocytophaga flavus]MDJ1482704.1 hypothetical protein [Xanthocytophaga flavus]
MSPINKYIMKHCFICFYLLYFVVGGKALAQECPAEPFAAFYKINKSLYIALTPEAADLSEFKVTYDKKSYRLHWDRDLELFINDKLIPIQNYTYTPGAHVTLDGCNGYRYKEYIFYILNTKATGRAVNLTGYVIINTHNQKAYFFKSYYKVPYLLGDINNDKVTDFTELRMDKIDDKPTFRIYNTHTYTLDHKPVSLKKAISITAYDTNCSAR